MNKFLFFCLFLCMNSILHAQSSFILERNLLWENQINNQEESNNQPERALTFEGAIQDLYNPLLPVFSARVPMSGFGECNTSIIDLNYESFDAPANFAISNEQIEIDAQLVVERKTPYCLVQFSPIRKNPSSGQFERVTDFKIKIQQKRQEQNQTITRGPSPSELNVGDVYKLATTQAGVHKLTYAFLKDELGINDLDNIDPRNLKLFGNGGGMLPESNNAFRYASLQENAILVVGQNDGSFDADDYILFYAEGPDKWIYDEDDQYYNYQKHLYDTDNHYFIRVNDGGSNGKRLSTLPDLMTADYTTNSFDDYAHFEEEKINLLDDFANAIGTGKLWLGSSFKFTSEQTFNFSFPNLILSEKIGLKTQLAGRAIGGGLHSFRVSANNVQIFEEAMGSVSGGIESGYANIRSRSLDFDPSNENINLTYEYQKPNSTAEGWLDYITLNCRRALQYTGEPMVFSDHRSLGFQATEYTLGAANNNLTLWDITDLTNVGNQTFNLSGSQITFKANSNTLRKFLIFDPSSSSLLSATAVGQINNQDLHDLATPNMLIIYHSSLSSAAQRLADHRRNFSNLTVEAIPIDLIYNEFSSGNADITAIRDFVKYLYDQPNGLNLKYLLLFGDASFDYKNIKEFDNNYNLIPTFETATSNHSIDGFPTDDYYGLLDANEGSISSGSLDVGIGRIPARTATEADLVVDKIIRYDTNPAMYGDWKNRLLFNADDEDSNLHLNQTNGLADDTANGYQIFNVLKNYFDSYQQVSTPGGNRYPDASDAIDKAIFKGTMVVNYLGHGGSNGWAQERVLTNDMIDSWDNINSLPLFITATCTFGPYDEPTITSSGERLVLKPDGGAIALFTTVRAVYASSNEDLARAVFDNIFEPIEGETATIGEILRVSKNSPSSGQILNTRKFTLMGDPALKLSHPKYNVQTTKINNVAITTADTIQALEEVTIEGQINNPDGTLLSDFNGILNTTIYDKQQSVLTLGNDPGISGSFPTSFNVQKNVIFKGQASVENGTFKFSFIMPSDIDFNYGNGKISYYADDGNSRDANGYYDGIIVGGADTTGFVDDSPPIVEVFLNDENFAFGGITDETPSLFVKLSDDKGINTAGAGIGHDITAIIDEKSQNTIILNDFYESELNNSKRGTILYPLASLEEGRHSVRVKAWDIANNSGEDYTEFIVSSSAEIALEQVLNYPNPFTTSTNFQFEHNYPGQQISVRVQIFTVGGHLVKTIHEEVFSQGYRVDDIEWDGTDDYGDRIGKGVYVYKVTIGAVSDQTIRTSNSKFEKLVILR